jgi:hypothetical protein
VNGRLVRRHVDAAADKGVRNSQPEGIGRVVALGDLTCWNNLGRNVVFADAALRPHAIFGATLFPDDDEASQYDLDVHAILDVTECGLVVVLNHFGTLRAFRRRDLLGSPDGRLVTPACVWSFVADVERTVVVAGRLVGSAPRSGGAIGLVISELLRSLPEDASVPTRLDAAAFGEVTALGVVPPPRDPRIAVGGDGKLALVPMTNGRAGRPRWETSVGFRVATIAWHGGALWAAGPDRQTNIDDYDWEALAGGGYAVFDHADGRPVLSGRLPDDVAWGTGGVAVSPFGSLLAAAGRTGCLHLVDPRTGASHRTSAPLSRTSLGIAHLAVVAGRVVCGFNRGGYRLHSFGESAGATEDP